MVSHSKPEQPIPAALGNTQRPPLIQHGELHTKSPAALALAPVPAPSLATPAAFPPLPYPPPPPPSQPPARSLGEGGGAGPELFFQEKEPAVLRLIGCLRSRVWGDRPQGLGVGVGWGGESDPGWPQEGPCQMEAETRVPGTVERSLQGQG